MSFRIVAHTKLSKGNHPPQTGPREKPHVCAGKSAVLPANVDNWTKEDVIVWVRQEVGLGGVAAALAGASLGRCVLDCAIAKHYKRMTGRERAACSADSRLFATAGRVASQAV